MSESSKDDGLEELFGIWADRNIDGLEYQLRIRSEWDAREKDIEEAFARWRSSPSNEVNVGDDALLTGDRSENNGEELKLQH